MLKKIDSRTKGLLWFLFQPEESSGTGHFAADRRRFGSGLSTAYKYREMFKSVVWIALSVLLSLILAHLK